MSDTPPTFFVWDSEGSPPEQAHTLVLWRGFGNGNAISIPRVVEDRADALRARFLGWVHDLGEVQIKGKSLRENLALRPGFSYWWMTLLAEKSYSKSPRIVDAVKLLALEETVSTYSARKIVLASGDNTLAQAFRIWCRDAGLEFEWQRLARNQEPSAVATRLSRAFPHVIRAAVYLLRTLKNRWTFRRRSQSRNQTHDRNIAFIDYLFNLTPDSIATGRYDSNYWTDLTELLNLNPVNVTWLHHYIRHEMTATTQESRELIGALNKSEADSYHMTFDMALGLPVLYRTVRDYLSVVRKGIRLGEARRYFRPANSSIDLWPLFEQDWRRSIFGSVAMANCLTLNLFEQVLARLPFQETGVYLQENQAWEAAFLHIWKSTGHGRIVGMPATTVRYWDLRYFRDPRSYERAANYDLPLPDSVALNGPAAIEAFHTGGFPDAQVIEVEALRYLYLADTSFFEQSSADKPLAGPLRVLILGDFEASVTHQQMQWLVEAANNLPANTRYLVKPHPARPIRESDYAPLAFETTDSPLKELLRECDVVFSGNITSAAVDAYCAGVPVVQMLVGNAFNMSPLRGLAGVDFVEDPAELAAALLTASTRQDAQPPPYFHLDPALTRWRALLGLTD